MQQAEVEITDEMIVAGRDELLRELTHPERDDIGLYKAAHVAEAVFRSMLAKNGLSARGPRTP